ncbi:LPS export ABC transporter periplasmic protein LptC [Treponema sp. OMZ 840]|uniref:LPS export ABC transporter periplasmic protein LptC n=1 Tax=Treponema sp. OMZ 840 TaxID=244313 RepID=UPI003D8DA4FF
MKNPTYGRSRIVPIFIAALLCICGCSLDYGQASQAQILSPEFVFYDARFTRVQNKKIKLKLQADKLEQYTGMDVMYGQNVHFALYDERGQSSLTGNCMLLSADKDNKVYHFFSNVYIKSYEYRAEISAQNLRWNEDTEILDSGKNDFVGISVEKPNGARIQIEGKGFSAYKKDRSFRFSENISGTLTEVKDKTNTEGAEDD